ncbi:uncharacterized protein LOC135232719 [Loxodonta africana]|uniref:uncharacterized protein LOC135232719 n=1 Tax=Loxodonta africana TaxID=9785 RepID=UPI0030D3391B
MTLAKLPIPPPPERALACLPATRPAILPQERELTLLPAICPAQPTLESTSAPPSCMPCPYPAEDSTCILSHHQPHSSFNGHRTSATCGYPLLPHQKEHQRSPLTSSPTPTPQETAFMIDPSFTRQSASTLQGKPSHPSPSRETICATPSNPSTPLLSEMPPTHRSDGYLTPPAPGGVPACPLTKFPTPPPVERVPSHPLYTLPTPCTSPALPMSDCEHSCAIR